MKQQVYNQMQKNCTLHSICGSYEAESTIRSFLGKDPKYKREFKGNFLHVPGSNLIVGGDLEDFAHARIEKGFMDKRQIWFNRRYSPTAGVIKFSFERKDDMWMGKYIFDFKFRPVEARTELIDSGPFVEISEKYKDIIDSFKLQLP